MLNVKVFSHDKALAERFSCSKATLGSSGFDLSSNEELVVLPRDRTIVGTGLFLEIPPGWEGQVRPRSGNAINLGLTVLNTPGTIDADYRGEIKIILYNTTTRSIPITKGMKIAQLVFAEIGNPYIEVVNSIKELLATKRQAQGFGSTGI